MRFDFEAQLGATVRSVVARERDGEPVRAVTLERAYRTTVDDLWDAVTSPERLSRWFLPVRGELRAGGRYQLEGNAGGTITDCDPPRRLSLTWEFGGGVSWVDVDIHPEGDARARLVLRHTCPVDDFWTKYGPGAVGVGWDLGLVGLAVHLASQGTERFDEEAFAAGPDGRAFVAGASADWRRAAVASGEDTAHASVAAERTTAFYTGEESPED